MDRVRTQVLKSHDLVKGEAGIQLIRPPCAVKKKTSYCSGCCLWTINVGYCTNSTIRQALDILRYNVETNVLSATYVPALYVQLD